MQLVQTPIQVINHPLLQEKEIHLSVKRDDLQHDIVSGNKLFKLHYHLQQCKQQGIDTIITFGGAYSNHLHATAFAAKKMGIKAVAIVRGELIYPLNPTLKDCSDWGMKLEPVSRADYKNKEQSETIANIIQSYDNSYLIAEGGCDLLGVKGAKKILDGVDQTDVDYIVCACGTGTTISGLIACAQPHIKTMGFAVLKGAKWMQAEVQAWLDTLDNKNTNWEINTQYHFGGYAKNKPELLQFIAEIKHNQNLMLEPVYTGKALFGLFDLIQQDYFEKGSRILFIHTGGLQGFREQLLDHH